MLGTRTISKKELLQAIDKANLTDFHTVAVELTSQLKIGDVPKKTIILTIEVE